MSPSLPDSYSPRPATMPCCFLHQKVRPGFFCCIKFWQVRDVFQTKFKKMRVLKQRDQKKQLIQSSLKNWFFFLYNRSWFFICFFILISISFVKGKEYQMQYFIWFFFIRLFFFQFLVFSFALPRLLIFLYSPILEKMVNNE